MLELNTCASAVDGDPLNGTVKLWQSGSYSIDELAGVTGCPPALQNYLPFFREHNFSRVYFTGIDFCKRSMNVYFNLRENGMKSEDDVLRIFDDLGLCPPSCADVLSHLTGPGAFAMTLSWDEEHCKRVCFYMEFVSAKLVPVEWRKFYLKHVRPHESNDACSEEERAADWGQNSCFLSSSFGVRPEDQYAHLTRHSTEVRSNTALFSQAHTHTCTH